MKRNDVRKLTVRSRWLFLVAGLVVLYVVVPRLGGLKQSIGSLVNAKPMWLAVALLATFVTYVAATWMYLLLAQHRLRGTTTFVVQLAGNFTNKLLPAGIGTAGINYEYLRRQRHSRSGAAAVVTTNNTLGFVGNFVLILGLVTFTPARLSDLHWPAIGSRAWLAAGLVVLLSMVIALIVLRGKLREAVVAFGASFWRYRQQPQRLVLALMVSMLLTTANAAVLYAAAHGIGLHVGMTAALIIMTIGVAGATVTPTPGGLGGAEAGLVAGFMLYGASSSTALAAALIFRLFTFWLPLLWGGSAFILGRSRNYY
ncbi:MAG TPA: lysylphosphatidylglycerol synthase transmembrane domain-containing protein [Candidatus Saccharimonadales bacterium]|nr:lysylphosphatidylglycerol synthase transmembrane domain-containing protein [Candidatus Saccharimonadales bacterium]